jgi:hypothetical protein
LVDETGEIITDLDDHLLYIVAILPQSVGFSLDLLAGLDAVVFVPSELSSLFQHQPLLVHPFPPLTCVVSFSPQLGSSLQLITGLVLRHTLSVLAWGCQFYGVNTLSTNSLHRTEDISLTELEDMLMGWRRMKRSTCDKLGSG